MNAEKIATIGRQVDEVNARINEVTGFEVGTDGGRAAKEDALTRLGAERAQLMNDLVTAQADEEIAKVYHLAKLSPPPTK